MSSRYLFRILIVSIFGFIAACMAVQDYPEEAAMIPVGKFTEISEAPVMTAIRSMATQTAVPSRTPALSPTPTLTNTPIAMLVESLCSPLSDHPIEELYEIVSDPYHPPPMGSDARHQGVDFSYYQYGDRTSIEGATIQAVLTGKVVASLQNRIPYGNTLIIETPVNKIEARLLSGLEFGMDDSLYVLYAHMLENPSYTIGDDVQACEAIGRVGRSGGGEGVDYIIPHLHLEMRFGPRGAIFESMAFYDARASQEEMENYKLWRVSGQFLHFDPMLLFKNYLTITAKPR